VAVVSSGKAKLPPICTAQLPSPRCITAGLLIRLTAMVGAHTHGILLSARQPHGLLYRELNCQKCRAWTGAIPKKDKTMAQMQI